LEQVFLLLLSPLFPLLGAGLLLCCVEAAATVGSWPPQASHRASAAFIMAAAVSWVPAPTASLMDGGSWIKNIARKRSLSGKTPGGKCCLSFLMRTLGLRPCISMGRRSNQNRIATCSCQIAQAKFVSKNERLGRVLADIKGIQNVPKDLLWQAGEGVGIFEFL
jgi:hypothetical protein